MTSSSLVGGALTTSPNVPLTPPTNFSVRRVGFSAATTSGTLQGVDARGHERRKPLTVGLAMEPLPEVLPEKDSHDPD